MVITPNAAWLQVRVCIAASAPGLSHCNTHLPALQNRVFSDKNERQISRARLTQWVADGADLATPDPAKPANNNEQLTVDQLTFMLNNGQAHIGPRGR